MALILFVYARTSIRAAKANAQRHREADGGGRDGGSGGGGLSLLNEHRRRHGLKAQVEGTQGGTVVELGREIFGGGRKSGKDGKEGGKDRDGDGEGEARGRSEEEERLRGLMGKKG
jgi:hypothetical protein